MKVTAESVVKVLDFGLTKLLGPAEAGHYVARRYLGVRLRVVEMLTDKEGVRGR